MTAPIPPDPHAPARMPVTHIVATGRAHAYRHKVPEGSLTVDSWFVRAPGAHRAWWQYAVFVMSLRDVPGEPVPERRYEGAEYELAVYALECHEHAPHPNGGGWRLVSPANFSLQFHGVSAAVAAGLCADFVQSLLERRLPLEPIGVSGGRERLEMYCMAWLAEEGGRFS